MTQLTLNGNRMPYKCLVLENSDAFICEYRTYAGSKKHDEHYQVWGLFVVSYVDIVSFRADDGCHTAEKHGCGKCCRYAYI